MDVNEAAKAIEMLGDRLATALEERNEARRQLDSVLKSNHAWQQKDEKTGAKLNKLKFEIDDLRAKLTVAREALEFEAGGECSSCDKQLRARETLAKLTD